MVRFDSFPSRISRSLYASIRSGVTASKRQGAELLKQVAVHHTPIVA